MIKFVYLFSKSPEIRILTKESYLTVLNMCNKLDLLQPKQEVFWHLTYSRSETNNAWKITLEVMKFFVFTSVIRLICSDYWSKHNLHKFYILWNCTRPTSYLYTLSTQNMTHAKLWNTCIASKHLGTFIKPVRYEKSPVRKGNGYDKLQPGQVLSSSLLVARRFQVRLDARAPSGESWNYLSIRLACNVESLTPSKPFGDLFLDTNLWQVFEGHS